MTINRIDEAFERKQQILSKVRFIFSKILEN